MHSTQLLILGIAAISCTVALAACGSANYNAGATTADSALTLSECMHSHGIKNFPDPTLEASAAKVSAPLPATVDPASPAVQHAVTACGGGSRRLG